MSRPVDLPLHLRLPPTHDLGADAVLDLFLGFVAERKLELYPAQEEAILQLLEKRHVILNTPTGSGKSLVALALHFFSLARGRRSVYTAPVKALVNEKFKDLCRELGADRVGLRTGDGSVNADAPVICCTAEVLANQALREGEATPFEDVIMDEFHFYSDVDRGISWQVPLLTMPHSRFLLMSATLGDTDFFQKNLLQRTGVEAVTVVGHERPVPLEFRFESQFIHEAIQDAIERDQAPIYVVHFTQREATERAQALLSVDFISKEQKRVIAVEIEGEKFRSPFGPELKKLIKHGVGLHHAGLLPRYRMLVEHLARRGLLKVICGTDTLGVGVNVPIRTVVFSQLCKFDGKRTATLSARDFHQIAGRAGRKGFDDRGYVVGLEPEHVVENRRVETKLSHDPKKARKFVKRKPPEHGFVMWDASTFERLKLAKPEALKSQFRVNHGLLLNVLSRPEARGCKALRSLLKDCHESKVQKKQLRRESRNLFESLRDRGIVEVLNNQVNVNVDLQDDFSLHQALSLYLVDSAKELSAEPSAVPLDFLTLCESICEDPDAVLRKQVDRLKSQKLQELKEEGVEYEERMEILETIEHPKPLRDWIYNSFNAFASKHPWVGAENIRPKSIVREMFEGYLSFAEYVKEYGLERSEGVLLRYLSDVYKVLTQTLPDIHKSDEVREIEFYLKQMIRTVDSSLMDEWEKMLGVTTTSTRPQDLEDASRVASTSCSPPISKEQQHAPLRDLTLRALRLWVRGDYEHLGDLVEIGDVNLRESEMRGFLSQHGGVLTDQEARSKRRFEFTTLQDGPPGHLVRYRIVDLNHFDDRVLELRFFEDPSLKPQLVGLREATDI